MNHMVQNWYDIDSEIILLLLKGNKHLREIARDLKISHSTISRKLNKLIKENVLDYKKEGKNKVFFIKKNLKAKNSVFRAERYKLNKILSKYPKLEIILEEILNNIPYNEVSMLVLFGSYAKGLAKKTSDIDIYINSTNKKIKQIIENIHSDINVKIGEFNPESLLIKEIIKNHIILRGVEEFYERIKFFK